MNNRKSSRISTVIAGGLALFSSLAWAAGESAPAAGEFAIKGDPVKGAETYKMYCLPCHGEKGMGDGVAAAALNPKPRNFTDKALMATIPDKQVYTVIKEGGASVGKSPLMMAWGAILGEDQKIHDVAAYVRSLSK
jgi:mono/diheme cytochrome c family protein